MKKEPTIITVPGSFTFVTIHPLESETVTEKGARGFSVRFQVNVGSNYEHIDLEAVEFMLKDLGTRLGQTICESALYHNSVRGACFAKLDASIDVLELSVRSWRCLQSINIKYLGELVQQTEKGLMKVRGFGRKSLYDVRDKLALHGLCLDMWSEKIYNWKSPTERAAAKATKTTPDDK